MGRQLIGRSWLPRRVKNERQPPASIAFSEQQPARLVVPGLDDTTREKDGAAEERLDIRCLDSMLLALAPVPGVPVELPAAPVRPPSHSSRLLSGESSTSYSVAIKRVVVKMDWRSMNAARLTGATRIAPRTRTWASLPAAQSL